MGYLTFFYNISGYSHVEIGPESLDVFRTFPELIAKIVNSIHWFNVCNRKLELFDEECNSLV